MKHLPTGLPIHSQSPRLFYGKEKGLPVAYAYHPSSNFIGKSVGRPGRPYVLNMAEDDINRAIYKKGLGDLGTLGQSDPLSYINAVGNVITSVTHSITQADVLKRQSKDTRYTVITQAQEQTKQLDITSSAAVEQARTAVDRIETIGEAATRIIIFSSLSVGLLLAINAGIKKFGN